MNASKFLVNRSLFHKSMKIGAVVQFAALKIFRYGSITNLSCGCHGSHCTFHHNLLSEFASYLLNQTWKPRTGDVCNDTTYAAWTVQVKSSFWIQWGFKTELEFSRWCMKKLVPSVIKAWNVVRLYSCHGSHFTFHHNCIMYFPSYLLTQTWLQKRWCLQYPSVPTVKDYTDIICNIINCSG